MDSVALWFKTSNEREERRVLRDGIRISSLSDKSFVKNFRLSKEAFNYVLESITDVLPQSIRSTAVTPEIKLATTLKFLGQGGYQHQIGQDRFAGLAQQTVSKCMSEICDAIEEVLCPKHINFNMTDNEKRCSKRYFYANYGIPGVIGEVDGTHIQMVRPVINEHLFFSRKLKHSINTMVICDHNMLIRAVNGCFGGACHDSHVWALSDEREFLKNNYLSGDNSSWVIGDSGYPLEPWILTPYRNASENSSESRYNEYFSKSRSIIERVFGVLKGRFRCLLAARELHYSPNKVAQILNVCCALHNICVKYNVDLPEYEHAVDDGHEDENVPDECRDTTTELSRTAQAIRNQIKNSLN